MTTFKDPSTVKIRENKPVNLEDNPKKANSSTLLDWASVCLLRMRDCQATYSSIYNFGVYGETLFG